MQIEPLIIVYRKGRGSPMAMLDSNHCATWRYAVSCHYSPSVTERHYLI